MTMTEYDLWTLGCRIAQATLPARARLGRPLPPPRPSRGPPAGATWVAFNGDDEAEAAPGTRPQALGHMVFGWGWQRLKNMDFPREKPCHWEEKTCQKPCRFCSFSAGQLACPRTPDLAPDPGPRPQALGHRP